MRIERYPRWLLVLPAALALAIVFVCLLLQQHDARALDGNGPDPGIVIAILLASLMGIVLAVTTLYALFGPPTKRPRTLRRLHVAAYHALLWLAVGGVPAVSYFEASHDPYRTSHTPAGKAEAAVAAGDLADVEKAYAQARGDARTEIPVLNAGMASAALDAQRVEVLIFLKGQGLSFAEPGKEDAWINYILEVLRAGEAHRITATVDTVQWLVDEGAPLGFSLKARASEFSSVDFYFSAYAAVDDPVTRRLLDLLTAHGADTIGCKAAETRPCPLVYLAGKGRADAVRYLLAHGAGPDSTSPDGDETALSEAIVGASAETVKLLLAAGAHVRFEPRHNDLATACEVPPEAQVDERKAVLRVLHEAHVRMSAGDLARYQGTIQDGEQRACIERFM